MASIPSISEPINPYTMNESVLVMRLKHSRKGTFRPQLLLALTVSLASMSSGLVLAWSNAVIYDFKSNDTINSERYSWICSLAPLGCVIAVMPCFYLNYRFGPKSCVVKLLAPISFLTWLLLAFVENREYGKFVIGCRLFAGFASCGITICTHQWLSDSVHPGNFNDFMLMTEFSSLFGFLVSGILDAQLSVGDLCLFCAAIVVVYFILMLFLPESPVHLCETSERKAIHALIWYLGEQEAHDVIRAIRKNAYARKQFTDFDQFLLTNQTVYKPLLIICTLKVFQCLSGYYSILFYYGYLWAKDRPVIDKDSDITFFLIFMIFNRLVAVAVYHSNPIGTRLPVLFSFAMLVITYSFLWLYHLLEDTFEFMKLMQWLSMPLWNCVIISYEMGLSLYPEIILRDYLPIQARMQAICYLYLIHWLCVFIVTKMFISALEWVKRYVYVCFAAIALTGFVFSYIFLINSKGLSLVQIQILFGGNPIGSRGASRGRTQHFVAKHKPAE